MKMADTYNELILAWGIQILGSCVTSDMYRKAETMTFMRLLDGVTELKPVNLKQESNMQYSVPSRSFTRN